MLFKKKDLYSHNSYNRYITSIDESLIKVRNSISAVDDFDIFLSHSYDDRDCILKLYLLLTAYGFSVYVDWIIDKNLNRGQVNQNTAKIIRTRMQQSKCLIYAISENATYSKWMPWELGYFDGYKGKVAILPIVESEQSDYQGQEYLSLYPYIDEAPTKSSKENKLWVNEKGTSSQLKFWLEKQVL